MVLSKDSVQWAISFVARHSDGDIFPPLPEIVAISEKPEKLIEKLTDNQIQTFSPCPTRRFMVPKGELSYRLATQLHPQDSILLAAVVYQYSSGIEERRVGTDRVYSYRFCPDNDCGLYGDNTGWNDFWSTAIRKSANCSHILYCDIADFYNQIYHHTVENQLIESGFPNQICKWTINLFKATTANVSRGVPIGPHPVHLIVESSLIPIDNALLSSGVDFIRYVDDVLIFCSSRNDAIKSNRIVADTLDKQQRIILQQHKTALYNTEEFQKYAANMIEDHPINAQEDKILQIIRRYSNGNPYAVITYNQVSSEDWREFSEELISGIINDYISKDPIDYIRLRWFFRRLAQIGHPGALGATIANIDLLQPCLPNICAYISSIQSVPVDDWKRLGGNLLDLIDTDQNYDDIFSRLSILSLFTKNGHINHFERLARSFDGSDPSSRREILLAAKINGATDWLRNHKESYASMDPWQKTAFIFCISLFPKDERMYFARSIKADCAFDDCLLQWVRAQ